MTLIYPSLYKQIRKKNKTTSRLQWTNALVITIFLILSGDIHPCPGPHRITPEEWPVEEHATTVLQVCPLYDALQCSPVHSNLSYPSSSLSAAADGMLGSRAGAVSEVCAGLLCRCWRSAACPQGITGGESAERWLCGDVRWILCFVGAWAACWAG